MSTPTDPTTPTTTVPTDVNIVSYSDSAKQSLFGTIHDSVHGALVDFYHHYIVNTAYGAFQVFQSVTYGEMVISFLLLCILCVLVFRWFWDVIIG